MFGLRDTLSRFRDDVSGTIIIIFMAVIIVVIFGVGLAVDTARATRVSNTLLASLDAAALVGAKSIVDDDLTDDEVVALVDRYFRSQIESASGGIQVNSLNVTIDRQTGEVQVDAGARVRTTLTQILNYRYIDVSQSARTKYVIKKAEVALVLDSTGSMNSGSRMDDLKAAATEAINQLLPPGEPNLNRISIVPYSEVVKAGAFADAATNGRSADGCVIEREGPAASSDEAPADAMIPGDPDSWVKVEADIPSSPNSYDCDASLQEVMAMSKVKADLLAAVDALDPAGRTAGHIGLAWGWYTISPKWNGIFAGASEPAPYSDDKTIKAIILMTDGDFNTSYLNGALDETSGDQTQLLCDAIKVEQVMIYTVGFKLSAVPSPRDIEARDLLLECASTGSSGKHFYEAESGAELTAAFHTIAGDIQALRLTK